MKAPKECRYCGAALDAGEVCECRQEGETEALIQVKQLPIIEERLRELKEVTERRVEEAISLVVSDETLAAVKAVRAELNRDFTEYENQRKAVKAAILAPYEQFEGIYRACVSEPFRRADAELKGKIEAVERGIKAQCEERLVAYFRELCAANRVDFLPFERTGVTVDLASGRQKTPKKLMEQLRLKVEGCAQDMAAIGTMEHGEEIAVEYRQCLDLGAAVQRVTERHEQLERERVRREEAPPAQQAAADRAEVAAPVPKRVQKAAIETLTCTFTVTDTLERLKLLKGFLDSNGYKYD